MPDHYYLIRQYKGKFVVDVGSSTPAPVDKYSQWFETFEEAIEYATAEDREYAITLGEGLEDYGGDLPDTI